MPAIQKSAPLSGCRFVLFLIKKLLLLGSTDGAGAGTGAALYTEVGIDLELAITLGDSANGTFCCASATCDASISDFVSHFIYLLLGL